MKEQNFNVGHCRDSQLFCAIKRAFRANYFTILFCLGIVLTPSVLDAQVSGTVFRDYNADGKPTMNVPVTAAVSSTTTTPTATTVAEPGVQNVVVKAYKTDGTSVSTTTSATGTYAFTATQIPSGTKVRIEFSGWLMGNFSGPVGTNSATSVQYKTAGTGITANFSINWPSEYCQATPNLLTSCFTDNSAGVTTDPSLIRFSTDQVKIKTAATVISSNGFAKSGLMTETGLGFQNTLGSVMGMTHHRGRKQIYSAAFVKVHDTRGASAYPSGIGAIFRTDLTGTPATTLLTTIVNVGTLTGASGSASQSDVGRKGLGDLELNGTEDTLFAVNIAAKKLIKIPLSSTLTAGTPIEIDLPIITGVGSAGVYPFGLAYNRGVLYITFTADGTGATSPLLKTFVYRYEGGSAFTQVLNLDMKYGRAIENANKAGSYNDNDHNFTDWNTYGDPVAVITGLPSSPTTTSNERARAQYTRSQPWLTDLAFDEGDMILGVRSRLGDVFNGIFYVKGGDILRACGNDKEAPTSWTIENDGTCGGVTSSTPANPNPNTGANTSALLNYSVGSSYPPAVTLDFSMSSNSQTFTYPTKKKEFYWDDDGWEGESTNGGVMQIAGYPQVFVTQDDWLGHGGQHGVVALNNTTGQGDFAGNVFYGFDDNLSWDISNNDIAKSGGLGDLIAECNPQPIEIGNSVWNDANSNGIYDAGELGIDGVLVELYDGATKVGTATTANGGQFLFNNANVNLGGATGIKPNTAYTIQIAATQFSNVGMASTPLSNLTLTSLNVASTGLIDAADNDATIVSNLAKISYTTGYYGENNHNLDFGLRPLNCSVALTTNVSGCFDSNGNTAGGSSVATVQAIVDWAENPSGETINVTCTGAASQSINPATSAKPAILSFEVPANGAALTIAATFSTSTACTVTKTATAPPTCPLLTPCESGNTGGTVWKDYNSNGVKDATNETQGLEGVTVKAYDCNNVLVGTTTTDAKGQYTFGTLSPAPSATNKLRIEFSNIPPQYKGTLNGANGKTDVQFISAAACDVDLGVNAPADYCQSNPQIITPCYVEGAINATGINDVLVKWSYDNVGNGPLDKAVVANKSQIGSTWGVAYNRTAKKVYTSALLKRHVGMGPNGLGAIYEVDPISGTPVLFVDAATLLGGASSLGTVLSDAARGLTTPGAPSNDPSVYDDIYKLGLGDIDISDDDKTLYVTDLFNKQILVIDIATKTLTTTLAIPNSACSGGTARPFGLKYYRGDVYAGVVCDAQTSQNAADLSATVYKFTAATGTPTSVINFPLDYKKGFAASNAYYGNGCEAKTGWYPWISTFPVACFSGSPNEANVIYPQPILADIEFDVDGSLIMAFNDRFGHQAGFKNYGLTGTIVYLSAVGGDILRASASNGGQFILESNGTVGGLTSTSGVGNNQGLNGGEFYFGDRFAEGNGTVGHAENVMGGLTILSGKNEVAVIAFDPIDGGTLFSGGVEKLNNTNGSKNNAFNIFATSNSNPGTFGKANGLGDLEAICASAPIEIGNYVWIDTDGDGVQDPCEAPLSMVTVKLYKMDGGTTSLVATTTTNTSGNYSFKDYNEFGTGYDTLTAGKMYFVVLEDANFDKATGRLTNGGNTYQLTTQNATAANGNDQNDSDAAIVASGKTFDGYPANTVTIPTDAAGYVNHTLDFGFKPTCDTNLVVNNATICNGTPINLFTLATGIKGTLTYSINGTTWTALANPTNVTPSVSTTYYVRDELTALCFDIDTLVITVNPKVTPTFTAVSAICSGATLSALPTTSTNGIVGTWAPALDNTATTTYTFTPSAAECATTATLTITVNPKVTPAFAAVSPICSGATLSALPTTSTNGIVGTWAPALDNTATTTYTFTPSAAECANATTLEIIVNPQPTLTGITASCQASLTKYDVAFTATGGTVTTNQGTVSGSSIIDVPIASSVIITVTDAVTGCIISQTVTPPNCSCAMVDAPTLPLDKSICQGAIIPALSATVGAGETIDWYSAATGGTAILINSTTYTPTVAGSYYAEARNTTSNCVSSTRTPVTLTINPVPTGGTVQVTKATCTNGSPITDGKIEITGITNGATYSYGTNGTTGLSAATATTFSGGAITISNLASPSVSITYTIRIYGTDATCYQDITAVLDPSVCPTCGLSATFTQGSCNSNNTSAITADDYFTVAISNVTSTNGGTSGKYEVVLNGTVLNMGGTAYGTSVTVGGILEFKSDGLTTYNLTVRDINIPTCTAVFATTPSAACSVVGCKPVICLPVTVTKF